jgi:hypothetical protein
MRNLITGGRQHGPLYQWGGAFAVVAVVAGIIWLYTDQYADECRSILVAATDSSCGLVTPVHDGSGYVSLMAAVLLIIALLT